MSDPPERFYLAAVVHSLGRRAAGPVLADAGCPRAAFGRLATPRVRPAELAADCARAGVDLLVPGDRGFPALLSQIADAPPILYRRGRSDALLRPGVAIVGARRCTRTGLEVAAALAEGLAREGVCVVSGLARGIDTAAHHAALQHGVTAAVVGSGLARPYPSGNRRLAEAMLESGGLLLSEYPPWWGARPHYFPERNRLISGIALGVVVVEAGIRSGSLITARMAAEQGREVCAVPGPVTSPASHGCHRLIQQGAALVESADDVLEQLGLARRGPSAPDTPPRPGNEILAKVLTAVEGSVTGLDDIVAATALSGAQASAALVELELNGFVRQVPGGYIRRPLR